MKRILVPTDFSTPADDALHYALAIANRFGSEITLLYLYQVYSTSSMFISVERFMKEDAAHQMLSRIRQAEAVLQAPARIDYKIIRADVATTIVDQADRGAYDLIIMGTQGSTGLEGIFLGSTTTNVLRRTHKPVLAVPAGFRFQGLQTIVLAMDEMGVSHAGVLNPLLQVARRFSARIHIFHKDAGDDDSGVDPSVAIFLDTIEHSFHYQLDPGHLNESIGDFVEETNADLLCMIRRRRGFLRDLFHVSATRRELFRSAVPLLVLHDVD